MEQKNSLNTLEQRQYQIKAWESMRIFTKQWIKQALENPKKIDFWTTMPIYMATGSGKTATVGVHINQMFKTRDRLEKITHNNYPLRVLVLNDRINLINQIKTDCISGRNGK